MTKNLIAVVCSVIMAGVSVEAARPGSSAKKTGPRQSKSNPKNKANQEAKELAAKEVKENQRKVEELASKAPVSPGIARSLVEMSQHKELVNPIKHYLEAKTEISGREGNSNAHKGSKNEASEALQIMEQIIEGFANKPSSLSKKANREAVAALMNQLAMAGKGTSTGLTNADVARIVQYGRDFLTNRTEAFTNPDAIIKKIAGKTIGPCKGLKGI